MSIQGQLQSLHRVNISSGFYLGLIQHITAYLLAPTPEECCIPPIVVSYVNTNKEL